MRGRSFNNFNSNERGSAMAEFAIVAGVFFMILISVIEFSRLLYTHNALTDAARRGARYASIHKEVDIDCVRDVIVYGENHIEKVPKTNTCTNKAGAVPLVNHIDTATINITYQGADTDNDPADVTPIDTAYGTNLGTVTVSIENYTFKLLVPYVNLTLNMPHYTTTLTAESAGEEPDDIVVP